jgi:hypothetical protein
MMEMPQFSHLPHIQNNCMSSLFLIEFAWFEDNQRRSFGGEKIWPASNQFEWTAQYGHHNNPIRMILS